MHTQDPHILRVINLWGAPSAGKSTIAAGLFFIMKIHGCEVELVTEYAKDLVWEGQEEMFGEQAKIFAEQNHRLERLVRRKQQFAITDSPLPLPIIYQPQDYLKDFEPLVMEQFGRYLNASYFIERRHRFQAAGRRHDEGEANLAGQKMEDFMASHGIPFHRIDASPTAHTEIFADLQRRGWIIGP
jgi:nicotinamide riboside kinase